MEKIRTESSMKGAFVLSYMEILFTNQKRSKDLRYKICKENILNVPVVILTRKNFFLVHAMNEKIELMKSAGLVEFWRFKDIDTRFFNLKDPVFPKCLTLSQLKGFFFILICGCFASFTVFILELSRSVFLNFFH